jgi:microcystin-dependent protein
MSEPFISQVMPVPFDFAPKGWARCDGQLLPINQNQALFSLLGTTYGGDGRVNFGLPNLRGRVAMHAGNGHTLGQSAGAESVTLTPSQNGSHAHTVSQPASKDKETTNRPDGAYFTVGGAYGSSPGTTTGGTQTSSSGTQLTQAHENRQPSLALTFVIALVGIFPSQN